MVGHLNALAVLTGQDVVGTVALIVDVLSAHQGSHAAICVVLFKVLAICSLVIVEVQQVVCSAALILLSCIEMVLFDLEDFLLASILCLHVSKAVHLTCVSLFAKMCPLVLNVLELVLANALVSHCEVLVKSFLLGDVMARSGIRVVNLSSIHELVVTACALSQSRILDQLFVFHSSLKIKRATRLVSV